MFSQNAQEPKQIHTNEWEKKKPPEGNTFEIFKRAVILLHYR